MPLSKSRFPLSHCFRRLLGLLANLLTVPSVDRPILPSPFGRSLCSMSPSDPPNRGSIHPSGSVIPRRKSFSGLVSADKETWKTSKNAVKIQTLCQSIDVIAKLLSQSSNNALQPNPSRQRRSCEANVCGWTCSPTISFGVPRALAK
jgi:hypothetical protein